jgi:class 3 adenylate cyclase
MGEHPVPEYRVMLTADIEGYSIRSDAEQRSLQEAFAEAVNTASDTAELRRDAWRVQVGGDSIFAMLPAGTSLSRLMDQFVRELDAWLGGYNRRRADESWTRMRLRLAVHAGPVFTDGATGWPGQHPVLPVRLRDCEPVRAALKALPSADLAVVVSGDVYRDYITQGPGNPRPSEFRAFVTRVKDKHWTGHLIVPGYNVHDIAALAGYEPDTAPTEATARHAGDEGDEGCEGARTPRDQASADPAISGNRAGRDFVNGDMYKAKDGGSIYQARGDLTLNADHQRRPRDE